jgi:hypothetical protein
MQQRLETTGAPMMMMGVGVKEAQELMMMRMMMMLSRMMMRSASLVAVFILLQAAVGVAAG